MSVRAVVRAWRSRGPRQDVGDPCEDCGTVLALCVQCGRHSRCLACYSYERSPERDEETSAAVRMARDHPEAALVGAAFAALLPAMLTWAGMTLGHPGTLRVLTCLAGAVACSACLAAGAAMGSTPLPGEIPACQAHDRTPYERWADAAFAALITQVALVCITITT